MTAQTPDPQSLVQTVRAALEAATTGPWIADDNDIWSADGDRFIGSPPRIADSNLIAHAALGPGEFCDICTHREMEQMIARAEAAETAIERVNEALSRIEADGREHLMRVGQHLHVSAEVLVGIVRAALDAQPETGGEQRPEIVCICGSSRFRDEITAANKALTLEGRIVLSLGLFGHSGDPITPEQKIMLDGLHLRKIDMADRVLVVNPGGYIGESTRREIAYATEQGKPIAYLEEADDAQH